MGLLGLDIGTTGCKATVFDYEGNVLSSAYREYTLENPRPGWEELNPVKVWQSVKEVIGKAIVNYRGTAIKAISVSSFGEAAVPIDRKGNVLHNSIIYIDKRGDVELNYIREKLGNEEVMQITGTIIHPMYSLGKLMWLKKYHIDVYQRTWKFLLYSEFILYKLGAEPCINYSLAARTMAFDITKKEWSDKILNCAGIDREKLPEAVPSGRVIGKILPDIVEEMGLPEDVLLVSGGHDQPCAALGAGIIESNCAVDGMGTVECITVALDRPVISDQMAKSNLVSVPHVKKDMYVTFAFNFTGGSLLKWYRNNFGYEEVIEAKNTARNVYDLLINKAAPEPTDLFILPYFAGTGTPYMDTEAKGVIMGLTQETGKDKVIRAILEGITYEMMLNLECLEEAGVKIDELKAVGGGARSEFWLQLKANMMGKKIVSLNVSEAGTLAVAMLAGTASGIYNSLEDAVEKLVKVKREFYPDEKIHGIYQEKYQNYKKIYPAVKGIV